MEVYRYDLSVSNHNALQPEPSARCFWCTLRSMEINQSYLTSWLQGLTSRRRKVSFIYSRIYRTRNMSSDNDDIRMGYEIYAVWREMISRNEIEHSINELKVKWPCMALLDFKSCTTGNTYRDNMDLAIFPNMEWNTPTLIYTLRVYHMRYNHYIQNIVLNAYYVCENVMLSGKIKYLNLNLNL